MVNLVASSVDVVYHNLRVLTQGGSFEGTVIVSVVNTTMKVAISSHSSLLIPEPFCGHFAQILRSHVTDPSGNFSAVDYTI